MGRTDNLVEKAYQLIKNRIISFEYSPGQKLEVTKLSNETGFSLSPIKIAIHRLSGEGFLRIVPQKGSFVTEIFPNEIGALMDYRLILERGAMYLAFNNIRENQIQKLRSLKGKMATLKREDNYLKLMELDSQYHFVIIEASGNPKLIEAYTQLSPHFKLIRFHNFLQRGKWSHTVEKEHDEILKSIENRDFKAVERAITRHISRTKEEFCGNFSKEVQGSVARMLKL